jgi:CubicO group peptidase (beta-lactamase class C family)
MSCSKIVTVCIIQKLVDEGKISLDDKVVDYLPWFKLQNEDVTNKVRIRHLISHCIGLPPFSGDSVWHLNFSQKEITEKLAQINMKNDVGQKYGYQNICVGIAGLLVEAVTGRPINVVAKEYIFDPLCMLKSSIGEQRRSIWQELRWFLTKKRPLPSASGHKLSNGRVVVSEAKDQYVFGGTSGVNSCTSDYIKLIACLVNEGVIEFGPGKGTRLFSHRAWQAISTSNVAIPNVRSDNIQFPLKRMKPGSFYYGNGMYGMQYGENDRYVHVLSHQGAGSGWRGLWVCVPEYKIGIVIFSNFGSNASSLITEALAYKFLDMYFCLSENDWSEFMLKKLDRIRRYYKTQYDCFVMGPKPKSIAGTYRSNFYGDIRVKETGDKVCLVYRRKVVPLEHVGGTVFNVDQLALSEAYGDDDRCSLFFTVDEKGNASGLEISLFREGDKTFKKIAKAT